MLLFNKIITVFRLLYLCGIIMYDLYVPIFRTSILDESNFFIEFL